MPPRGGTTFHENIPLLGGASATRRWGGLWLGNNTHPGASRPLSLRATPPMEGILSGEESFAGLRCENTAAYTLKVV